MSKGKIIGFQGNKLSGLAELIIETRILFFFKRIKRIPCERTTTTRALESAYGETGITTNNNKIEYWTDKLGILQAFMEQGR